MSVQPPSKEFIDRAFALHQSMPVSAGYFEFYGFETLFSPAGSGPGGCDFEKMDRARIRCFGIALANGGGPPIPIGGGDHRPAGNADWAFERGLSGLDGALSRIRDKPRIRVVECREDLDDCSGDTIHVIPLVTSHLWMRDLEAIDIYFERGLRISHCAGETWCRSFPFVKVNGQLGPVLSRFGEDAVGRMNELGILLDMAHMSDESTEAIIRVSTKPVVDGHTSSTTAVPECRGHSDAVLRAIADTGGVAGIHFADHMWTRKVWEARKPSADQGESPIIAYYRHLFETVSDPNEIMNLRKNRDHQQRFFAEHGLEIPPRLRQKRIGALADMADHVEHMVKVMGIEHVGLGGDVNGITPESWPLGCDDVGELPHLTAELMARGWSDEELSKFLSKNWFRVFRDCLPTGSAAA